MTSETPTASLTTAAEKQLHLILRDVCGVRTMDVIETLKPFLTTYAAQVRRDALMEAIHIVRHDCSACQGSGLADPETECEYCGRPMQAIRALPPVSPSSQTDTGDK